MKKTTKLLGVCVVDTYFFWYGIYCVYGSHCLVRVSWNE